MGLERILFDKLEGHLSATLEGFEYLIRIEKGDIRDVLSNPEKYALNHISGNIDAWNDEEVIVFEFNDGRVHFCFTPLIKSSTGLKFVNGSWE